MVQNLKIITAEEIEKLVSRRVGETKLGERVQLAGAADWEQQLIGSAARYVLLGIPEDIGVRANFGTGGAASAWIPALKALLNVQETDSLHGSDLFVLGSFDLGEWMQASQDMDAGALRQMVARIDDLVYPVIETIARAGKIPVVIGGGHNNAYPILKGVSKAKARPVSCINLDAHCDYRVMEGRHSGNGFRYAKTEGWLQRYAILGLHRNYNSQNVVNDLAADQDIHYTWYEDIFLEELQSLTAATREAIRFTEGSPTGIEIDLDCIENTLSSAATPSGVAALHARQFIRHCAKHADTAYLHITEGAVRLADGREHVLTAKLIAYLVTDFIRS